MSVTIFVADLAEFSPLVEAARGMAGVTLAPPRHGYWRIQAAGTLALQRKALGLRVALWNSALSGGIRGRLVEYTNDRIILENEP
ncbi:hypothetical protein GCM10010909_02660 [Acidocella aquatica]|uniref:Uncharacterized protein n=1 Tax=Acidocella aquatica TaxID=1922313 RepID=A0ABQ6A1V1_9PROT|nr:hypothetical protein [Acidocella aquatica]GLR65588.1 hypothetical protein GCM10010909_02660 [Acidocella aquatica]